MVCEPVHHWNTRTSALPPVSGNEIELRQSFLEGMTMGIPSTSNLCHCPSSASRGHATGLTEIVSLSIPNFPVVIEKTVLVVAVADMLRLIAFASEATVAAVVEFGLPGFVPEQTVIGPEVPVPAGPGGAMSCGICGLV